MSWGTLEKGILTGRVTPERTYDATDVRHHAPWWTSVDHTPYYQTMNEIRDRLDDAGHSGLELALGFALGSSALSTALCGGRTPSQLEGLVAALENLPNSDLIAECQSIKAEIFAAHSA